MIIVSVTEAKKQLSKLLDAVDIGEKVIITRHGKPIVKMVLRTANPFTPA
jgi:prevent-host-death family protein